VVGRSDPAGRVDLGEVDEVHHRFQESLRVGLRQGDAVPLMEVPDSTRDVLGAGMGQRIRAGVRRGTVVRRASRLWMSLGHDERLPEPRRTGNLRCVRRYAARHE
jgi:hypothetical protein